MSMVYLYDRSSEIFKEIMELKETIIEYENAIRHRQNRAKSTEERINNLKRAELEKAELINDVFSAITCEGMQTGVVNLLSSSDANIAKRGMRARDLADLDIHELRIKIEQTQNEIRELEEEARKLDIGMPY